MSSSINKLESESGLSQSNKRYSENMIKGRIAEALVEQLFLALEFNVFRYGMENSVPGIMKLLREDKSIVAKQIRRMPDFIIQNPNTNESFFVEVKFRANEQFSYKDLKEDYPFENALIILVSKKHIKCLSVAELKAGECITETSKNYLGTRKEFNLEKEVIIDFCKFANKFFENV